MPVYRSARLIACVTLLAGGCSLLTNPSRVRFEGDDAGSRMDSATDEDAGAGEDGGPPPAGCGDGVIEAGVELCDDGNPTAGDGCSDFCIPEGGFDCSDGAPTVCTPICGDGVTVGTEACDDGALDDCGTCNVDCTAAGAGSTCGDGVICASAEACDDLNVEPGDGCTADCAAIETGWACAGEPSVCSMACGDGILDGADECDDGGNADGDGCSAVCTVELGWTCTDGTSCISVCGDGLVVGLEPCDDGNADDCGACNASCTEPGTGLGCGLSVGCREHTDCESMLCTDGLCAACASDGECPASAAFCENSVCNDCNILTGEPCADATPYCGGTGGTRFTCVECTDATHCASLICQLGVCVPCETNVDCGGGTWLCCDGVCADGNSSTAHCGGCGMACGDTCLDGACI